jgi:hypothetical protein
MLACLIRFVFHLLLSEVKAFLWKQLEPNSVRKVVIGYLSVLVGVELVEQPLKLLFS